MNHSQISAAQSAQPGTIDPPIEPHSSVIPVPTATGATVISRVAERHWHALDDDRVVGRGEVFRRPDGRQFLSIDAWHGAVFEQLAAAMLPDLARPLYTVVDEADTELTAQWLRAGFAVRRRENECVVATDPAITGLGHAGAPPGVTVLAPGRADGSLLRALDRAVRDEVGATIGWQQMPAEVLAGPAGETVRDPAAYAVAVHGDQYVGLLRLARLRRPRIGLIAVRQQWQRRGIARALLAEVLGGLHCSGNPLVSVDLNESNRAGSALFEGIGAHRESSNLELVSR